MRRLFASTVDDNGLVEQSLLAICVGQVGIQIDIVRVEFQRMLSVRDGVVEPTGVDVSITKSVADNGREWIEPHRFLILIQSAIELAAVAARVTQPDMPQ